MKLFVWDFHGVLEKGNELAVLEISNIVLNAFGYKQRLSEQDCQRLYGLKWFQFFEWLLPRESHSKHIKLQNSCVFLGYTTPEVVAKHIEANEFSHEILGSIQKSKHNQILISNTDPKSLNLFLATVKMKPYFQKGSAFAANAHKKKAEFTKKDILINFLNGRDYKKVVVIGDSSDDMELASVSKGVSYLYSHPGRPFKQCYSDYRINDLRALLREI